MNAMANLVTRPLGLGRIENLEEEGHSAEELRAIASEAADTGVLSQQERHLILNSLVLGRRTAKEIMVPRMKVEFLDLQENMQQNREVMAKELLSRFPLCDGGLDHVVGIVETQGFLFAYNEAAESSVMSLIAKPAVFAPENVGVDKLLALFNQKRTEVVLLVDEYGAVAGLVSLQDGVDELMGDPQQEGGQAVERPQGVNRARHLPLRCECDFPGGLHFRSNRRPCRINSGSGHASPRGSSPRWPAGRGRMPRGGR
jgi:CBS domain containing-hemolysin-like protein